jgi:hypothetical protein
MQTEFIKSFEPKQDVTDQFNGRFSFFLLHGL